MPSNGIRGSNLWTWTHITVIVACGVMVLFPPAQHFKAFMIPFSLVLMPFYFYLLIRSVKEDKTANLSMSELHTQVKGGRRLPKSGLMWAAAIAMFLASIYSSSGHG